MALARRHLLVTALALLSACRKGDPAPPQAVAESAAPAASAAPSAASTPSADPPAPPPSAAPAPSQNALSPEELKKRRALFESALGRGRKAARNGRPKDAIDAFNQAAKADPTDPRAPAERGHVRLLEEEFDKAEADSGVALRHCEDPALCAQVWLNIALAREKQSKPEEEVRVAYANAYLARPSNTTRSKLAGKSTCTVEIHKRGLENMKSADGWRGLFAQVGRPEDRDELGNEQPTTEERAKAMVCAPDHFDQQNCSDTGPFWLMRRYMMYTHDVAWVIPRKDKGANQFWVYETGRAGGWPAHCTGSMSIEATVDGDVVRVVHNNDGVDGAFEGGEYNDESRCTDGAGWTNETFFDMQSGKAIASIRWIERSRATLRVDGRSVVVSGGGCDERIKL